jgi:hypothetical protein
MLFTSIQCPHAGCANYNKSWAIEVGMKNFQFENPSTDDDRSRHAQEAPDNESLLHIIGELVTSGYNMKEIAKRTNLSKATVCLYLHKYHVRKTKPVAEKSKSVGVCKPFCYFP